MTTLTHSPPRTRSSNGAARTNGRSTRHAAPPIPPQESDRFPLVAVISVLLGILVGVLGIFAIAMWFDAHNAKNAAERAASKVDATGDATSMPGMNHSGAAGGLTSYAGAAPSNAEEIAKAHKPFNAVM